jgi:hypothetical protein
VKLVFSRYIFKNVLNIIFNQNPSSGSRVVPSGHRDKRTDGRKDAHDERHFAKAPKNVEQPDRPQMTM